MGCCLLTFSSARPGEWTLPDEHQRDKSLILLRKLYVTVGVFPKLSIPGKRTLFKHLEGRRNAGVLRQAPGSVSHRSVRAPSLPPSLPCTFPPFLLVAVSFLCSFLLYIFLKNLIHSLFQIKIVLIYLILWLAGNRGSNLVFELQSTDL